MRPQVILTSTKTKKVIAQKVKRALKKANLGKEYTLFCDWSMFCSPGKVGRKDMMHIALEYVDLFRKVGKKVVPITQKELE